MNIKAIALSATLALGSLFGSVAPAEAGTCWELRNGRGDAEWCQVNSRINNNGHKVWDVAQGANKITFVLWENGQAEMFADGLSYDQRWVNWYVDNQGDVRVTLGGTNEFSFRA